MATRSPIEHWDDDDGALSEPALRRKLEARGYRVERYVYPPGTYFPPHRHACDKLDAVVSGCLRITLDGVAHDLRAGDCLFVPAGAEHDAEVIGAEPVVSLDGTRT